MIKKIFFITGNKIKVLHATVAFKDFGIKIVPQKLDIIEPREENPEKIVAEKTI